MERVTDSELPGVDQTDDVAGVRDADRFAVAPEEPVRATGAYRTAHAAVEHDHVLREPAGADAHECHAVAMPRIHIRLDLEDEAREPLLGRRHHARVAGPRLRGGRKLDERMQKRLEAEVRERAAEEDRRLLSRAIAGRVEGGTGMTDDIERFDEMRVRA